MELTDVFLALGERGFAETLATISIGKLRAYNLYEPLKTRARLAKLNVQGMRKAVPRFWERLGAGDGELASDLAQAVLVSNLDMIVEVLDFLGISHHDGFFEKDLDASGLLTEGWREQAFGNFRGKYPEPLLLFYLNHLAMEVTKAEDLFTAAGAV
jgi:hypothetical protein